MGADADRRNVAILSGAGRECYPVTVLHEYMRSDAIDGVNLVDSPSANALRGSSRPSTMTRFSRNSIVSPGRPMTRLGPIIGSLGWRNMTISPRLGLPVRNKIVSEYGSQIVRGLADEEGTANVNRGRRG